MCAQFEKPSCSKDFCNSKLANNLVKQLGECLKPLDDLLRCDICFEYFNICMTTKCNHNYCSSCIRRTLTYKAQCPKCFQEVCEPELKNNRLVDDILLAYQKMRDDLDNFTDDNPRHCNPNLSSSSLKLDTEYIDTKLALGNTPNSDDEFSCSSPQITAKAKICDSIEDKKVSCPVCSTMVFPNKINSHLDLCLSAGMIQEDTVDWKQKRKPLQKVMYSHLSDNDIKKYLKSNGLRTTGTRQELIHRHENFLILYNSDCNSLNPMPGAEIVKQVEKEEMDFKNCATSTLFQCDDKSHPKMIRREYDEYVEKHAQQFSNLITEIQRRELERERTEKENMNKFEPSSNPVRESSDLLYCVDSCEEISHKRAKEIPGAIHSEIESNYYSQISDCEISKREREHSKNKKLVKKHRNEE